MTMATTTTTLRPSPKRVDMNYLIVQARAVAGPEPDLMGDLGRQPVNSRLGCQGEIMDDEVERRSVRTHCAFPRESGWAASCGSRPQCFAPREIRLSICHDTFKMK